MSSEAERRSQAMHLEIDNYELFRRDGPEGEGWTVVDADGKPRARVGIKDGRAFAYVGDNPVMDMRVDTVRGARTRPDGHGLADEWSRKAVLKQMMILLPIYF